MSLKIVIFGASGGTGQLLTSQALAKGHTVTAVTRRPEQFSQRHKNLRVVSADTHDPASVSAAIVGQDVVMSSLGVPYSWKEITFYTQSATALVQSMQAAGVRRWLCVSSGGTNPNYDPREGFVFGLIIKPLIGRTTYKDMRNQENIAMASNLDWTILRPAQLVDHPTVTAYQVEEGYLIPGRARTARIDLADFMVNNMTSAEYIHKAVAIASPL